ncbi:DUF3825 domain-containing protein [Treponema pedis]|uniref:DUF3825 domain-containing protein n=1 Tax=Treponema pedis TaxID=409322 RepID=UPI0003FE7DDD|nr:DUF3825 domain-containing protein [Treponema pedis]
MNDKVRKYDLLNDVIFKSKNTEINNKQAFFDRIKELASIIPDEDWTYTSYQTGKDEEFGILYRYLTHMYEKIKSDSLILFSEKPDAKGKIWMYWHTGLFDTEYDDMIFVAQKYANSQYPEFYFSKFEKRSVIAKYTEVPQRANFFEHREMLVFDPTYSIDYNIAHLLADNISRFPDFFKKMETTQREYVLDGAIKQAVKRVYSNFTEAAPSYYNGRICFLLPLYLKDRNAELPDLVLAVSQNFSNTPNKYYGHTCLTLPMAYNDARLICKPLQHWIRPKRSVR